MSMIDDILFAPIAEEPWRKLVREVIDYYSNYYKTSPVVHRVGPPGALSLVSLMEKCHKDRQITFYVVNSKKDLEEFVFSGIIYFGKYEDYEYPALNNKNGWSIRDLNLFPNGYNKIFIFATEEEALAYQASLN